MMRRWQSHQIVEADEITDIVNTMTVKSVTTMGLALEAERRPLPDNFFDRGTPQVGDYLIRHSYETNDLSWSPKAAFEEGYTLYEDPALDFQIHVSYRGQAFVITEEEIEDNLTVTMFMERAVKLLGNPALILRDRYEPRNLPPADVSAASLEQVEIELPDGVAMNSMAHPSETDARDKLVRFLVARIAKFEQGYDASDALRMEELSWLLLQAVGGQIL